jgi:isocitrate/isopropylmalate dehydrogenase
MFECSLQRKDLAQRIEDTVEQSLQAGILTADLGGNASTEQVCERILSALN